MAALERWLRVLPLRLRSLVRRDQAERELADEIEFHIEQETMRYISRGLSADQARSAARRDMYGIEALKDVCRDVRGTHWLDSIMSDVRYAFRTLRRSPGFAVVAVLTLAVGIGVNAAVFTVADAVLFKGFRLVDNDRLLYIHSYRNGGYSGVSYPDLQDWRMATRSFDDIGAAGDLKIRCDRGDGFPELCFATRLTANAFRLLGVKPILGRDFVPSDQQVGAASVAILSYGFWDRRFGKDPEIIGRTMRLGVVDHVLPVGNELAETIGSGASATIIIGVMPKGFSFPQDQDIWVPLIPTADLQQRDARTLWFAFGRLAEGATRESARAELEIIGSRLANAYPHTNRGEIPHLTTFTEFFVDPNADSVYKTLWGAVGFVLLIACANLANLLLGRAAGRSREMAVRAALGAGRWRLVRQHLIESLVLSISGGVLGWALATVAVRMYVVATNPPVGTWNRDLLDYAMDLRVFFYLTAISIGAGVLFGLAPALRFSTLDVNAVMKDGGPGATSGKRSRRLSSVLVIAEVALAVVLLAGAGVMVRSVVTIGTADIGARTTNIAAMLLRVPGTKYPTRERQVSFYERLKTHLEALPGVESMALGPTPAQGSGARVIPYDVADDTPADERQPPITAVAVIGPDYFRVLRATVLSGRDFNSADGLSAPPVALVNQRFASHHWSDGLAVGQRVRLHGKSAGPWLTVVGVVSNVVYDQHRQRVTPVVYLPYAQSSNAGDPWVQVRTAVPVNSLITTLRREINVVEPDVIVWLGPYDLAERLATTGAYGRARNNAVLFVIFAAVALVLASIGLYAVVAHSISQRTQEIGLRTAIGATTRDIAVLVFRQGMRPLAVGLTIGLIGSLTLTPVLKSQLVGVQPVDPLTLAAASTALVLSAILGCWIPARRAMRVDPVVALRHD